MDWLRALFTDTNAVAHIILVYALVVALGTLLGRIKVAGISLGVTFVLFVGLAAGHFGLTVPEPVLFFIRDFGLTLFIFFVGLQVGPSFFSSFKSGGLVLNLLTVMIVLLGIVVTVALWFLLKDWVSLPQMLGVHYGAVTNTPGLGATQEALDLLHYEGENIAVAYACAYPLGVVGAIFSAVLLRKIFSIDLAEEDKHWETEEKEHNREPIFFHVEVTNPAVAGKTLGAIREFTGRSFICSRILSKGELSSPTAETVVQEGDVLRIVAAPEDRLPVTAFFGGEKQGVDLATEKSPLATRTILITREKFNGMTLKALALNQMDGVNITRVFRAGMTLFPYSNLHLQVGDQVYCVGPEPALHRLETLLGNKMKKLYHPNIFTIFVGLAFGIVLGSIPIAVPGMPAPLKLGLAGGPLIVAILLGRFGNFARLVTYTTQSASLMMREIGISLFLASVGLAAGESFVAAITQGNGLLYVLLGLFVTLIPLIVVGIVARKVYRINYHSIVGLMAGATTDPPALAYAATLSEKNSSSVAYSTVYPLAMFLRILTGQLLLVLLWGFIS
ncbi:MAG TPA: putative transporter [Candidatus Sutterella merdavium]|nr:putative transporter [Candidatus Sutterella merdavium]